MKQPLPVRSRSCSKRTNTTYSYVYSFDGEGALTSAIDYVISDELPKLYMLEGHGEVELPAEFRTQIEKENIELDTFSLLSSDGVPEDADAVLIYAPESDISAEEADMLIGHLTDGGKLLVMAGPTEDGTLTNLYKVLSTYGVEAADGIDVSLGGESYTFVRTAPEDGSGEDPVWTYNGEEFDVYDLKTALRAVSAAGFTVETPSGQEEISLTVYLDNADFPSFTLTLYRYDGENCIAAVDGKAAAFVSRSQTVDLIEAVNRLTLGS